MVAAENGKLLAMLKVMYQGSAVETGASTVAQFLKERGVEPGRSVVEYRGDVLVGEAALETPLVDGSELNVFRICAGG